MKRFFFLILLFALIVSCAPAAISSHTHVSSTASLPPPTPVPAPPARIWWQDAVFYEIFVRSFNDSDGDGIGDFNGLTKKLEYLQSLGVTAIWLMPIHPSPSYHGYDVLNYYAVNPQYGTLADFNRFLGAAHSRGIRVIIDLVLNHTSSQHPWFVDANSDPKSKYRDWYIWSDSSLSNKWAQGKNGFYYAYFWEGMPDLNYRNSEVTLQMEKMSTYWLKTIGVDGFRIDAVKHLIEEGAKLENTSPTHAWLQQYYTYYKSEKPDSYVVGEVAGAGGLIARTYAGQMDQIFNFELANAIVNSARGEANSSVTSAFKFSLKDKPDGNYATFLTNHDQNRVMSVLNGDVGKARVAASLLLTAPGTPFIYYGEELGQQGQKPDEDIRLPMQWTSDLTTAGFTTGTPWRSPAANTATMNVASEDKDENSLLNHYRTLIGLRKQYHALQTGALALLETDNSAIFASLRIEDQQAIMVLINMSSKSIPDYKLKLAESVISDGAYSPEIIFGNGQVAHLQVLSGKFSAYQPLADLPPYSTTLLLIKR